MPNTTVPLDQVQPLNGLDLWRAVADWIRREKFELWRKMERFECWEAMDAMELNVEPEEDEDEDDDGWVRF